MPLYFHESFEGVVHLAMRSWEKTVALCLGVIGLMYCCYLYGADRRTIMMQQQPLSIIIDEKNCSESTCASQILYDATGDSMTRSDINASSIAVCKPHDHIVYIKTHKTGSTTLQQVFQMYGYRRNLSFLFNAHSPTNGHIRYAFVSNTTQRKFLPPIGVASGDYANYRNYDILAAHVKYNRSALGWYMQKDSKYVSIVREPAAQFESAFDFFRVANKMDKSNRHMHLTRQRQHSKTGESAIDRFLKNPDIYKRAIGGAGSTIWMSMSNGQMLDLGMDRNYIKNDTMVERTVSALSKQMDLVLITEYFDESLILLKKLLCWSFEDIVYFSLNQRGHTRTPLKESTKRKIRQRNHADVILYAHFNDTLWQRIEAYGPSFQHDLDTFRKVKKTINDGCLPSKTNTHLDQKGIVRYKTSKGSPASCKLFTERKLVFNELWKRQKDTGNHRNKRDFDEQEMKKRSTSLHIPRVGHSPRTTILAKSLGTVSSQQQENATPSPPFQCWICQCIQQPS